MKKKIIWWALKDRKGNILKETIQPTKYECADEAPNQFSAYWSSSALVKRIEKQGYKFCRVEIKEVKV